MNSMYSSSFGARVIGSLLLAFSVLFYLFTLFAYWLLPSYLAAYTIAPLWLWAMIGLVVSVIALYLRARFSVIMLLIWALTTLVGTDEARVLTNIFKPKIQMGEVLPYKGETPLRVLTINCAKFQYGDPTDDILKWQPDIVFLQEVYPMHVRRIAKALYGKNANTSYYELNGIASRYPIVRQIKNTHPKFRYTNHIATVQISREQMVNLLNIHLSSASTNLQYWRKECWKSHRKTHLKHSREVAAALRSLKEVGKDKIKTKSTIMAGDFNASAYDAIKNGWKDEFIDSYYSAARGWGNTFHRRFPILRLDRILATPNFIPIRSRTVATRQSDHRFVVTDYIMK